MIPQTLSTLFSRDLQILKDQVNAYSSEESLWIKADGITNTGGNLSLHLSGNLQHFIGALLGGTSYVRDRPFEFSGKVTRQELLDDIDAAEKAVTETLNGMDPAGFEKEYPIEMFGGPVKTEWFVLHLYSHFSYHLGQINYHRRLLDK